MREGPWTPWYSQDHKVCNDCGVVVSGPQKGKQLGPKAKPFSMDAENVYWSEEEAIERNGQTHHNVSGTLCPDCIRATQARFRAGAEERRRAQQTGNDGEGAVG